jgi:hypothetical protein
MIIPGMESPAAVVDVACVDAGCDRFFASPKSSTLYFCVGRYLDVGWLQIPMNDSFFMRHFERIGDLLRYFDGVTDRNRTTLQPFL